MSVRPLADLREPTDDDAPSIATLLGELGYPTTADAIRARLVPFAGAGAAWIAIAVVDGEIVGVVTVHSLMSIHASEPVVLLSTLVVAATHQGRGVGTALVAHAEEWAHARGAVRISVSSGLHRDDAHDFYERRGYGRSGVRLTKTLPSPDAAAPG